MRSRKITPKYQPFSIDGPYKPSWWFTDEEVLLGKVTTDDIPSVWVLNYEFVPEIEDRPVTGDAIWVESLDEWVSALDNVKPSKSRGKRPPYYCKVISHGTNVLEYHVRYRRNLDRKKGR